MSSMASPIERRMSHCVSALPVLATIFLATPFLGFPPCLPSSLRTISAKGCLPARSGGFGGRVHPPPTPGQAWG